jgi:hypothetical protein
MPEEEAKGIYQGLRCELWPLANSLRRGQQKRTMRPSVVQLGIPGFYESRPDRRLTGRGQCRRDVEG